MRQWLVSISILAFAVVGLMQAAEQPKSTMTVDRKKLRTAQANHTNDTKVLAEKTSASETTVKQVVDGLLKAYASGDAKAFSEAFTTHGEYIDAKGTVFHGRKAIEAEFAGFFKDTPGTTIEMDLAGTRPLGAGIITGDCTTRFRRAATSLVVPGRCQLVCSRENETWFIASLHESESSSHHDQVKQLEWLVGDWIGEGSRSHVHFHCKWDEGGNFLLRDYSVQIADDHQIKGTQRIGFDPLTGHLKAWIFDSAGGFSDGEFNHDGDQWILKTSGVTSEGRTLSVTNVLTRIDEHRMTSELTERYVGGERMGETEKLTIVRKHPASKTRVHKPEPQNK